MYANHYPGHASGAGAERHILQIITACHPMAGQTLGIEDNVNRFVAMRERRRLAIEAGLIPAASHWSLTRLRRSAGAALIRCGERLGGQSRPAAESIRAVSV